jgi:hypothetical protein
LKKAFVVIALVLAASHMFAQEQTGTRNGPQITFEENRVAASGLTPGAQVAWFSVAREPAPFVGVMVRREAILASDVVGTAVFELDAEVPLCSIWVAVDLASGEFTVAVPPDYPLRELNLPSGTVRNGPKGKLDRIFKESHLIEVFVARPGTGAWVVTVADGSEEDEDGPANGTLSLALDRMAPVNASPPPPDEFAAGDVFVAIDPEAMAVAAVHAVGPKP